MSLKIFGGPDGKPQKKKTSYADDVVGRFRSGHQVDGPRGKTPVSLAEWRVTTGDPEVAEKIHALLGGESPTEWEAAGEDNIEVFTEAPEVNIILEGPNALRQVMVLYGRNNKVIRVSDGETIQYPDEQKGNPDPQAGQTFAERKAAAKEGTGSEPKIEVFFRLADDPELGLFKFQSGSWSMVSDLAYHNTEDDLADYAADSDGKGVLATLKIEEVSFTAKSGPRAGQLVTYKKPVLTVTGPVK